MGESDETAELYHQLEAMASSHLESINNESDQNRLLVSALQTIELLSSRLRDTISDQNRLENLYAGVADFMIFLNPNDVIEDVNDAVVEQLGFSRRELIGKHLNTLVSHNEPIDLEEINETLQHHTSCTGRLGTLITKNKTDVPVTCSISLLSVSESQHSGKLLIAHNITRLMAVKKELEESENKFRSLFEDSRDSIFITTRNGSFIDLNSAAKELFRLSDHYIGRNAFEMIRDDGDRHRLLRGLMTAGFVREFELVIVVDEGVEIDCSMTASLLRDSDNEVIGCRGIIRDVTKFKRVNAAIMKAIVTSQEHERQRIAKDLHDGLNQMLAGICIKLSAVSQKHAEPQYPLKEKLTAINAELNGVIDEVRNIAYDLMPNVLATFGLIDAVYEIAKDINERGEVVVNVQSNTPTMDLEYAVQISLYRVVQEFIQNTMKHAQASRIDINFMLQENVLTLDLEDDGIGFDVTDKVGDGLGLGSLESRVKSLNGDLHIDSKPGSGTTYHVKIDLENT